MYVLHFSALDEWPSVGDILCIPAFITHSSPKLYAVGVSPKEGCVGPSVVAGNIGNLVDLVGS